MASFPFELVSPERLLVSEQVDSVTAPGLEGEFTVMAGHAPLIALLRPGIVTVTPASGPVRRLYVRGGFAEVNPTGLTILADNAFPAEELDGARLTAEIEAARSVAAHSHDADAKLRAEEHIAWISDLGTAVAGTAPNTH
ncbi:F0F1 ATP synthase subunit epsilon [Terrihabitans sp. B22-R8]|uniref:F0F1 ATP synthase subunit epsilon n=1 Tax=Terrihabitans sp. B22-R8 TaxID=3425128 RepID=UPI00403C3570